MGLCQDFLDGEKDLADAPNPWLFLKTSSQNSSQSAITKLSLFHTSEETAFSCSMSNTGQQY